MTLSSSDIKFYRSSTGDSVGGAISASELVSGVTNNLFPHITDGQRIAGGVRRHKMFVANESGTDDMLLPVIWLATQPTNMTELLALGFDDADDDNGALTALTQFDASALVSLISSAADTRTGSIWGLDGSGVPAMEAFTLTGTSEVLSAAAFSVVYAVHMDAQDVTNTVTIKQGAGGTTRGEIPPGEVVARAWIPAYSKATGIKLPNLTQGSTYGIWREQTWVADAAAVRPNTPVLQVEEAG